jgi:hypothetical protein
MNIECMVVHMIIIFKHYKVCFETLGLYAMGAKLNLRPFVDSFFSPFRTPEVPIPKSL